MEDRLALHLLHFLCKSPAQRRSTSFPEWLCLQLPCQRRLRACLSTCSTRTPSSITWSSRRDLRWPLVGFLRERRWLLLSQISLNQIVFFPPISDFALSALKNSFSMSSLSQTFIHPDATGTLADTPPSASHQTPDVTSHLEMGTAF